jgi:hypothetical protein
LLPSGTNGDGTGAEMEHFNKKKYVYKNSTKLQGKNLEKQEKLFRSIP